MKKENIITKIAGLIFLIWGITAISHALYYGNPELILWACYISLIILGVGFLIKNKILIESQINFLAFPLLFWTIDFLQYLFTGNSFLGIADYFFNQGPLLTKIITSQHLWALPLAIFSVRYLKSRKNTRISILYSISYAIIIFILSRIFISKESNINMVYSLFDITGIEYIFLWLGISLTIITITYFTLKKLKVY